MSKDVTHNITFLDIQVWISYGYLASDVNVLFSQNESIYEMKMVPKGLHVLYSCVAISAS